MADSTSNLNDLGLCAGEIHWNLTAPSLYEASIRLGVAKIAAGGPMVVDTTPYTGRSPNDKFIVSDIKSNEQIAWGKVNVAMDPEVSTDSMTESALT